MCTPYYTLYTVAASRLSPDRIVAAAVAILEEEGLEALSMRRLAESLEVWPMAVYRHFQDKDALLDAIVEEGVGADLEPRSGSWRERLGSLTTKIALSLRRYPAPLRARFLGPPPSAGGQRLADAALAILRDGGFEPEEARRGWRMMLAFAAGDASLDPDPETLERGVELLLDGLEKSRR